MDLKKCTECSSEKPLAAFSKRKISGNGGQKGELTAICTACMEVGNARKRELRAKRKRAASTTEGAGAAADQEGAGAGGGKGKGRGGRGEAEGETFPDGAEVMPFEELLVLLRNADKRPFHLKNWKVNIAAEAPRECSAVERANLVSESIGEAMLLRWMCVFLGQMDCFKVNSPSGTKGNKSGNVQTIRSSRTAAASQRHVRRKPKWRREIKRAIPDAFHASHAAAGSI